MAVNKSLKTEILERLDLRRGGKAVLSSGSPQLRGRSQQKRNQPVVADHSTTRGGPKVGNKAIFEGKNVVIRSINESGMAVVRFGNNREVIVRLSSLKPAPKGQLNEGILGIAAIAPTYREASNYGFAKIHLDPEDIGLIYETDDEDEDEVEDEQEESKDNGSNIRSDGHTGRRELDELPTPSDTISPAYSDEKPPKEISVPLSIHAGAEEAHLWDPPEWDGYDYPADAPEIPSPEFHRSEMGNPRPPHWVDDQEPGKNQEYRDKDDTEEEGDMNEAYRYLGEADPRESDPRYDFATAGENYDPYPGNSRAMQGARLSGQPVPAYKGPQVNRAAPPGSHAPGFDQQGNAVAGGDGMNRWEGPGSEHMPGNDARNPAGANHPENMAMEPGMNAPIPKSWMNQGPEVNPSPYVNEPGWHSASQNSAASAPAAPAAANPAGGIGGAASMANNAAGGVQSGAGTQPQPATESYARRQRRNAAATDPARDSGKQHAGLNAMRKDLEFMGERQMWDDEKEDKSKPKDWKKPRSQARQQKEKQKTGWMDESTVAERQMWDDEKDADAKPKNWKQSRTQQRKEKEKKKTGWMDESAMFEFDAMLDSSDTEPKDDDTITLTLPAMASVLCTVANKAGGDHNLLKAIVEALAEISNGKTIDVDDLEAVAAHINGEEMPEMMNREAGEDDHAGMEHEDDSNEAEPWPGDGDPTSGGKTKLLGGVAEQADYFGGDDVMILTQMTDDEEIALLRARAFPNRVRW